MKIESLTTVGEIHKAHIDCLRDACQQLILIAGESGYTNPNTPETESIFLQIKEAFRDAMKTKALVGEKIEFKNYKIT